MHCCPALYCNTALHWIGHWMVWCRWRVIPLHPLQPSTVLLLTNRHLIVMEKVRNLYINFYFGRFQVIQMLSSNIGAYWQVTVLDFLTALTWGHLFLPAATSLLQKNIERLQKAALSTSHRSLSCLVVLSKLDGVGAVDNRPSIQFSHILSFLHNLSLFHNWSIQG